MISNTPPVPYYAVIFTSTASKLENRSGYNEMDKKLSQLVREQPGFLGFDSVSSGIGITVSYWKDLDSILAWKKEKTHLVAQAKGRDVWYKQYKVRICKVERDYGFGI